MRTSVEVYQQIRWDPRFDPTRFVLCLDVHRAELKRVPLTSFVPGGDVPWHRIVAIEAEGEIVWDRRTGVDRLREAAVGRAKEKQLLRPPFFTPAMALRFDLLRGAWVSLLDRGSGVKAPSDPTEASSSTSSTSSSSEPRAPNGGSLRVVTWNTLWGRFLAAAGSGEKEAARIATQVRRSLLLEALGALSADIVALQEVEVPLLAMILAAGWVRSSYVVVAGTQEALTTDSSGGDAGAVETSPSSDLAPPPGGLVLLSKLPVREAALHLLGPHKAVTAIHVDVEGRSLVVATTHLTSDHAKGAPAATRARELDAIHRGLVGQLLTKADASLGTSVAEAALVLLGDFNERSNDLGDRLEMRDAWLDLDPAPPPTFDPIANPLAALASRSGVAARLDRVLFRAGSALDLEPASARLAGDTPHRDAGVFVSDHYGVEVHLRVRSAERTERGDGADQDADPRWADALASAPSTRRTALAWLPSAELSPAIQKVRVLHDPQVNRWPPHVNVLFGFLPESRFEQAAAALSSTLAGVSPFAIVLEGVRRFEHASTDPTLWLDPTAGGATSWHALRDALAATFPRQAAQTRRGEPWQPHLTVGRGDEEETLAPRLGAELGRRSSIVSDLVLLSRRGDEPMRPRARVALATGKVTWVEDVEEEENEELAARSASEADAFVARIERGLPAGSIVHVVGSRRVGTSLPGGDLDLVVIAESEEALAAALTPAERSRLRRVADARVPGFELRVSRDLDVDMTCLVAPPSMSPSEAVTRRFELGDDAACALAGVSDAEALRAALAAHPAGLDLARTVKAWAHARGLDAAAFGGLPSVAWLAWCADTLKMLPDEEDAPNEGEAPLRRRLVAFFERWASLDVATLSSLRTPTPPVRPCADQVGLSMRRLLVEELYRGWEIASADDATSSDVVRKLTTIAPPLHRRHRAFAVITIDARTDDERAEAFGAIRRRMVALVHRLEADGGTRGDVHAWPHPFGGASFAIGLGQAPPSPAKLEEIATPWLRQVTKQAPGVTVRWVDGGDVPTLGTRNRPDVLSRT